jgi:hypothetical protein
MVYVKPQVNNVLSASLTIQGVKGTRHMPDNDITNQHTTSAAYEADE